MWKLSLAFLVGLGLLLSPSLYSLSPEDECEHLLLMCEMHLDATTSEIERLANTISEYRTLTHSQSSTIVMLQTLTSELRESLSERDNRLRRVEDSFNDYVRDENRRTTRNLILGIGGGLFVGFVVGVAVN